MGARMGKTVDLIAFVDQGLGNSSCMIDLGDGRALVIDTTRDPAAYLKAAEECRLSLAYSAETHLHADFVSGSRELATQGTTSDRSRNMSPDKSK
jgi:hydroxyacylglutathione hydrolase